VREQLKEGSDLAHPLITLTDTPDEADAFFLQVQVHKTLERYGFEVRDDQAVNQLAYEACVVLKHHLPDTIDYAFGSVPWIPKT
jgi:hypothetical protein